MRLKRDIVWMHESLLEKGKSYWIKHNSSMVSATIKEVNYKLNLENLEKEDASKIGLNDICQLKLSLSRPLVVARYQDNKNAGNFIIIDRVSNATLAAGMISGFANKKEQDIQAVELGLKPEERAKRFGQKPFLIIFTGLSGTAKIVLARALERRLFESGYLPYVLDPSKLSHSERHAEGLALEKVIDYAEVIKGSGCIAISAFTLPKEADRKRLIEHFGKEHTLLIHCHASDTTRRQRLDRLGRLDDHIIQFENPKQCDLVIETNDLNIQREVNVLVNLLAKKDVIY